MGSMVTEHDSDQDIMTKSVAFITIGQTPRDDILPEILPLLPHDLDWQEYGAMDGLAPADIVAGAPQYREERLVSRLSDGSEAVVSKAWLLKRLQALIERIDDGRHCALVLLCTGDFGSLESKTLLIEAQGVLDGLTDALADGRRSVGILVPLEEQCAEFAAKPLRVSAKTVTFASPYSGNRIRIAARELAKADFAVMHCLGYTEAMRERVAAETGRPVLLARRALAGAIAQVL